MNFRELDWTRLDRLRRRFLDEDFRAGAYWDTTADLEQYDATFGERIGWKWDAFLDDLALRGWHPPAGATLIDWGCGSGVASRRVLRYLERCAALPNRVLVHDRSPLAADFARKRLNDPFPSLDVRTSLTDPLPEVGPGSVVVISHVLNELTDPARDALACALRRADVVLWVEPGTRPVARALQAQRDRLRDILPPFHPCPHDASCPMLSAGHEADWCHHFASPPAECFTSGDWAHFAERAGIDLRSLPYSCLAVARPELHPTSTVPSARMIGLPRVFKAHVRLHVCTAEGVGDVDLSRRTEPDLHRAFRKGRGPATGDWRLPAAGNPDPTDASSDENPA